MKRKILPIILSIITTASTITPAFANNNENIPNISNVSINTFKDANIENEESLSKDLETELDEQKSLQIKNSVQSFSEERIEVKLPEERIEFNPNARISGAHTPDTAFYLPENLLNQNLSDTIGAEQNWYYFQTTENSKVSLTLQMPQGSEYDLALYKYNDGYLDLVSVSQYYGTYEHLSYVDEPGIYFFGIIPYTPANNEEFIFRVDTTTNYDENEPDDNIWFAKEYTNNILAEQTIDNPYDEDFFKLNINRGGNTYISLGNIATEKYSVYIYDENLNVIGSFLGDNKLRKVSLPEGNYYLRVSSYDGNFNPDKKYKLIVNTVDSYEKVATSIKGDIIRYDTSSISVNGKSVPLTWEYEFKSPGYPYYSIVQRMKELYSGPPQKLGTNIKVGTFHGKGNGNTDNAIMIPITNVYLFQFFYATGGGTNTQHTDITEDKGYLLAIIDADSGKIIETSANMLYSSLDEFKRFFKEYK